MPDYASELRLLSVTAELHRENIWELGRANYMEVNPLTYKVKYTCTNCFHTYEADMHKGIIAPTEGVMCPNCECETGQKSLVFLEETKEVDLQDAQSLPATPYMSPQEFKDYYLRSMKTIVPPPPDIQTWCDGIAYKPNEEMGPEV